MEETVTTASLQLIAFDCFIACIIGMIIIATIQICINLSNYKPFKWDYQNHNICCFGGHINTYWLDSRTNIKIHAFVKGKIFPIPLSIKYSTFTNLISNKNYKALYIVTSKGESIDYSDIVKWRPNLTWKQFYHDYC